MKLSIKNSNTISRNTQENALVRALQFLRAVGTDAAIMEALKQTGFNEAAQKQGWSLVLTAYAASSGTVIASSITATPITAATEKVESWQSAMFVRAHAALRRFHPEQDAFVFTNLEPGAGIASVPAVAAFLDRLDALESSPERKASRKADHAALDTLSQRGVTKDERKEMRTMVKWIEATPAQPQIAPVESPREAALIAVYEWVQDWSDCARTVITRRDQLIRLGIGKRRARKQDAAPPPAPAPVPVVVTPVVPGNDTSAADPALMQSSRQILALPPKPNGVTPGALAVVGTGGH